MTYWFIILLISALLGEYLYKSTKKIYYYFMISICVVIFLLTATHTPSADDWLGAVFIKIILYSSSGACLSVAYVAAELFVSTCFPTSSPADDKISPIEAQRKAEEKGESTHSPRS